MTYEIMERIIESATIKAAIFLKYPTITGSDKYILEGIALKQYFYEKETEGETD